jgi:hypothetical protein
MANGLLIALLSLLGKIIGKRVLLGRFLNEIDASNAYQSKLKEVIN